MELEEIMNALRNAHAAGDTAAATRLAAMAQQAQQQPAAAYTVIATTDSGGKIYEMPDGQRGYFDDSFSTRDPARIAELMAGASPVDLMQGDLDRERIAANPVAARGNEFIRGVPFLGSYTDEAVGAFSPEAGENMRAMAGAMQRENPRETMALNVGGGIASAIPAAFVAGPALAVHAAKTVGGRVLQGAAFGAAAGGIEGAIYGAGEGQGAEERAKNAGLSGLVGLGLGGVLGAAAPYAATGVKTLMQKLRGQSADVISSELNIGPQAAAVIRQALVSGDDGAAVAALKRAGPDAMLADANPNTQSLLDTTAQSPGAAGEISREAVNERTQRAAQQMVASLDDILGAPQGAREIISDIAQQSAPSRSASYDAAYAAAIDYSAPQAQQIESLLQRVPESAIRRANELMRIRGEESAQIIARIGDDGSAVFETLPDVRQIDYITRALNDVASEADGAGKLGGQTDLGMSIQALSRGIRTNLRALVPEYGAALEVAADAIGQRNAVDTGYELLRAGMRREDIARALHGATDAEKAAMRQGVRSFIDDATANVTRTITDGNVEAREGIQILRQMSSRANQTKLRMLLGEDSAEQLLSEIDQATTAFELRAAIAINSKTYARGAMNDAVAEQVTPSVVQTLAQGEPVNATKRFVQALTGETAEAQTIREMGIYEEIARALVNTRGPDANRALVFMQRAIAGETLNDRQAELVARAVVANTAFSAVPAVGREVSQVLTQQ